MYFSLFFDFTAAPVRGLGYRSGGRLYASFPRIPAHTSCTIPGALTVKEAPCIRLIADTARRIVDTLAKPPPMHFDRPQEVLPAVHRRSSPTLSARRAQTLISTSVATLLFLTGCASSSDGSGIVDRTLQAFGVSPPTAPSLDQLPADVPRQMPTRSRQVTLRLHAGEVLNTDDSGQSLSVVARVYKLRDKTAFERAELAAFADPKGPKGSDLAQDIVESREVILTPGQRHEVIETVPAEAPYIGVVALFRAPAERRWRFVFDTKSAASTGITMGVHACALSVSTGNALDVAPEMLRVAGVQCVAPPA